MRYPARGARSRARPSPGSREEQFVGRTEKEVAWRLDSLYHELGADEPAFPTIVAAGANGATPHAHAGDDVIPEGRPS